MMVGVRVSIKSLSDVFRQVTVRVHLAPGILTARPHVHLGNAITVRQAQVVERVCRVRAVQRSAGQGLCWRRVRSNKGRAALYDSCRNQESDESVRNKSLRP